MIELRSAREERVWAAAFAASWHHSLKEREKYGSETPWEGNAEEAEGVADMCIEDLRKWKGW